MSDSKNASRNNLQLPTTGQILAAPTVATSSPEKFRLDIPGTATAGQMLAPATTAPQKLSIGGSATGNPRNKCALKPGHSLMDWIRLGNSGVDLAGTHGRVTPVSGEELARHNTRDDAWLAIRGKVFNVTRYMDFHPGGVDELMRGVGRDATQLFDDVHAWVNYQQLLVKCYVGPLRTLVKMDTITERKIQDGSTAIFGEPPVNEKSPNTAMAEIVPRFDWIQKRQDLSIYFYTRQLCNPGLVMLCKSAKTFQLKIQIDHLQHIFELELHDEVQWPPTHARVTSETGKIEVTFTKVEPALWTTYGAHTATKASRLSPTEDAEKELQYEYEVAKCLDFNDDSFELCLRGSCKQNALILPPIGYHVVVAAQINGDLVRRSYTPFNGTFFQHSSADETYLSFLIKSYAEGTLSKHLRQRKIGEMLLLSAPRGNFRLQSLQSHRQIALIAAGSGLTPMLNLIAHLLKRNVNRIDYLRLMYFNKTPADIWYRNELERIAIADERLQLVFVLSEANDEWAGLRGRISNKLLAPLMTRNTPEYASFVAICGPSGFSQAAEEILKELKFEMENVHIFQG